MPSNILTDWRQALVAYLDANLQGGIFEVLSGDRDEESKRHLAVVFVPKITQASDILLASPPMVIRAWIPKPRTPNKHIPGPDPGPLEQLAIDLETTLETVQTSLLPGRLYFWVAEVVIDYIDWGVQATLASFTGNPAVAGA